MSVVYLKFSGVFFKGNIGGGGERLGSSGSRGVAVSPGPSGIGRDLGKVA